MGPVEAYWLPPRRVSGRVRTTSKRPLGSMNWSSRCSATTRPKTTLLNVSPGPTGSMLMICSSWHSMHAGDAATRGGLTLRLAAFSSPAISNSSVP